jgi:hypothetical protein
LAAVLPPLQLVCLHRRSPLFRSFRCRRLAPRGIVGQFDPANLKYDLANFERPIRLHDRDEAALEQHHKLVAKMDGAKQLVCLAVAMQRRPF